MYLEGLLEHLYVHTADFQGDPYLHIYSWEAA